MTQRAKSLLVLLFIFITGLTQHYTLAQPVKYVVKEELSGYQGTSYAAIKSVTLKPGFEFTPVNANHSFFISIMTGSADPIDPDLVKKNTVRSDVVRVAGVTNEGQMTADKLVTSYSYLDGLGRPVQRISAKASPQGKDMVQALAYDSYGRQAVQYLPYTASSNTGSYQVNALAAQQAFYQASGDKIADDAYPFSVTTYDDSPLNRVTGQASPGSQWQPGAHSVKTRLRLNAASEMIKIWTVSGPSAAYYGEAQLSVEELTDENGNKTEAYTNKLGQRVLKRVQADATTWLETVYIYDDTRNLKYQVSPEGVKRIHESPASWGASFINTWAIAYTYDGKGRLVEKQAPGAKPVYMVYNRADRLILTQDGRNRAAGKWLFSKYDVHKRTVMGGLYTDSRTRQAIQEELDAASGPLFEETAAGSPHGYSNQAFPLSGTEVLAVHYYDNYDFDRNGSSDYSYQNPGIAGAAPGNAGDNTGRLTGLKKRILGTSAWITEVVFYDERGNAIQKQGNNQLNASVQDITSNVYNFIGEVLATKQIKHTGASIEVLNKMEYDHAGRPLQIKTSINGGTEQTIAAYEYNELGQLADKKLHRKADASYLQSVDFRYTIRGWLRSINNSSLANDGGSTNDEDNDLFGMSFHYDDKDAQLDNNQYYNGRISAIKWKTNDQFSLSANPLQENSYRYSYDKADRLTAASFASLSGSSWSLHAGAYDEIIKGYDHNGNMTGLLRYTQVAAGSGRILLDDLSYSYKDGGSNQLSAAGDAGNGTSGFIDGAASAEEYIYDDNGSLAADANKGVVYSYNELDKIKRLDYADGRYIEYSYDALGARLGKTVSVPGQPRQQYDYIEGFVYTNSQLSHFAMAEGRVRAGSGYTYEYFIRDHLNNVRISFEDNGTGTARIVQENHYYAFGMTMKGLVNRSAQPSDANKLLFNGGSELQDDFGEEHSYSTYYREYDPVLGRFNAIDAMVDTYAGWTPYNFAFNDPVNLNDPLGDDAGSGEITNPGFNPDMWEYIEEAWKDAIESGHNMAFRFNQEGELEGVRLYSYQVSGENIYIVRGSFFEETNAEDVSGAFELEVRKSGVGTGEAGPESDDGGIGENIIEEANSAGSWSDRAWNWAKEHFEISGGYELSYGLQLGGGMKEGAAVFINARSTVHSELSFSNKASVVANKYSPGQKITSGIGAAYFLGADYKRETINGQSLNTVSLGIVGLGGNISWGQNGISNWFFGFDPSVKAALGVGLEGNFRIGFSK